MKSLPPLRHLLIIAAGLGAAGFGAAQLAGRPGGASAKSSCESLGGTERTACYRQLLSKRLTTSGVAAAATTLDSLAAGDHDIAQHAHEYAHGVGIEAYGLSDDIAGTFAACGDGFSSGCRHGVIQAYFEARDDVTGTDVEALCEPFKAPGASRWVLFQCVHGMGHGLTMFHGHDLPKALTGCDMLRDSWDRESCYGGAFMENVINATAPHHPATQLAAESHHHVTFKAIDPAEPLYPCSIMEEKYLHACYQMQTSVILHLNGGKIGAAAKVCDRAPVHMRPVCYQSLGRDVTAYTMRNSRKTAELCRLGSPQYRPACYVGAAKALVDWTATTDTAFAFCGIVAAEPGGPSCYQALGEEIATLLASGEARAAQCDRAQDPMAVAHCRRGAGLR
jgi:hypothetical protein